MFHVRLNPCRCVCVYVSLWADTFTRNKTQVGGTIKKPVEKTHRAVHGRQTDKRRLEQAATIHIQQTRLHGTKGMLEPPVPKYFENLLSFGSRTLIIEAIVCVQYSVNYSIPKFTEHEATFSLNFDKQKNEVPGTQRTQNDE